VDDLRDFTDPDEGYRDTDWDSHLNSPEAFYAEALPCESCGRPVDAERKPALWDESLLIGPCCASDVPAVFEVPLCPELYRLSMLTQTVGQLLDSREAHRLVCRVCNPELEEMKEAA
jgi:hypothetical protein